MITEVVGPSGTGKTTLMATLEIRGAIRVLTVPRIFTRNGSVVITAITGGGAALRGLTAATILSAAHGVPPSAWLRLARNCVAVEHAWTRVRSLEGNWFVDEGPLRQLRDRLSGPGSELIAWKHFATKIMARIARRQNSRMIVLDGSPHVYEWRYQERTSRELEHRRIVGGFRDRLGLFLEASLRPAGEPNTLGTFIDDTMEKEGAAALRRFRITERESSQQVASRFIREVLDDER